MAADYQQYPFPKGKHPPGWVETTVGEVMLEIRSGYSSGKHNQSGQGIPHLRPMNVSPDGEIFMEDVRYVAPSIGSLRLTKDDVLFTNTSSTVWVGKTALVAKPGDWGFSNHMTRLRVAPGMSPEFVARQIHYLCLSGYFAFHCKKHINQSSVSGAQLSAEVPFRLPPATEQTRITAKLNRLLTRERKLRQHLDQLPSLIQQYRAAVLEDAYTGRLVPTEAELARKERREFETASVLLKHILTERRSKWEADQLAKMRAAGKEPKDTTWKNAYEEPGAPRDSNNARLPSGWIKSSLGQCFEISVGGTPSRKVPAYWNGTIPWVSSGEVQFCQIRDTHEKLTRVGLENSNTKIHGPGTVMLGMVGEGKTRGQAAILEVEAAHNQNSAAIGVPATSIPPRWVFYWLWYQYQETRGVGTGNSQPALNKQKVGELPLNLPPLAEQHRILAELERRLSALSHIEEQIKATLEETTQLRTLLFQVALSGKLINQSPTDESADQFLQRIAAAREAHVADQKKSKAMRMTKPKRLEAIQLADELLDTIEKHFGGKPFTFEQLAPHLSADYESVKIEIFNLLATRKGRRLKQVFNQTAAQMELQKVAS